MAVGNGAPFTELERSVQAALGVYSNVHRGSGHFSLASTHLFEQARQIVLEYLGLDKNRHQVVFCTPRGAELLKAQIKPGKVQELSSQEIGLPLGVRALAVQKRALPGGVPFQTGGGTARLVSPGWVIWAKAPDRFEAGTPAIINIIAFARALQLVKMYGKDAFFSTDLEKASMFDLLHHDLLESLTGGELLDQLKLSLIGRDILVPTAQGERPFINLDNAASTPTFSPVWDVVRRSWRLSGEARRELVGVVRSVCSNMLDAPLEKYDLIFTSNTTEAINLAAENLSRKAGEQIEPVILNTLLEHNSNELAWRQLPGHSLVRLAVDEEGFINLQELESVLKATNQAGEYGKKRIVLVAISGASNVLGTFNDLGAISRIVHRYGAHLLVDGAQMVAHRKVEVEKAGIDYLVFSAHKVYAPFGTGVFIARKGLLHFDPTVLKRIIDSGEENIGGIAALGKALLLLQRIGMDVIQEEERRLTGRLLAGLKKIEGIKIYGIQDTSSPAFERKGGVLLFGLKNVFANRLASLLAEQGGIGVRSGCHCAHMLIKHLLKVSPSLQRFQGLMLTLLPRVALPGLTRFSLGIQNDDEDVDMAVCVLEEISRQAGNGVENNHPRRAPGATDPDSKETRRQIEQFVRSVAQKVF